MDYIAGILWLGWILAIVAYGGHVAFFWKVGVVIYTILLLTYAEWRDRQHSLA
jgi:hypothetical protein